MCPAARPDPRRAAPAQAGFTLLEVLVALALAAALLAGIGAVWSTNARAARTLEERTGLMATARAVMTGIAPRAALRPGRTDGEIAGHRWRMDVRPLPVGGDDTSGAWVPWDILIRVRAPSGAMVVLETVRLGPGGGG